MKSSEKWRNNNPSSVGFSQSSQTTTDDVTDNSSLSSRVTTWSSLPRTRAGIQRSRNRSWNDVGQPKRTGKSFQASLRPYREVGHRSHYKQSNDNDSTKSDVEEGSCCLNACGQLSAIVTPSTSTRRMLFSLILSSIFCVFATLQGPFKAELERHRLESRAAHNMHFRPLLNDITSTMDTPDHSAYDFSKVGNTKSEKSIKGRPSPTLVDQDESSTNEASAEADTEQNTETPPLSSSTSNLKDENQETDQNSPTRDENQQTEQVPVNESQQSEQAPMTPQPQVSQKSVVAYVLPIFSCYPRKTNGVTDGDPVNDDEFHDAAFMLQASIHDISARNPSSGSSYDYQMVAILHTFVQVCQVGGANRTQMLMDMGYKVHVVREPIHQVDIRNIHLQRHAPHNNGPLVGMKEMIRLYAFTLEQYPIVTLVEFLTWMVHPPDAMYDVLLNGPRSHKFLESHPDHVVLETFYPNGTIIAATELPREVDVIFARNYASLGKDQWSANINLSFLPIRPSKKIFKELISTYQSTEYDEKWGWDHKGYSSFPGSMTSLGLLTYYYNEVRPDRRLEVDHCIYNNMASVPYIALQRGAMNQCRDVKLHKTDKPCPDCRLRPWDDIIVANFAICLPAWTCHYIEDVQVPEIVPTMNFCRKLALSWFSLRQAVEESFDPKDRSKQTGTFHPEIFKGYCQPGGFMGGYYVPTKRAKSHAGSSAQDKDIENN